MRTAAFYLDGINPLRGLKKRELISMFEQGERGYYARLQWLYRLIEKRDPVVRAVKKRLLASLGSLEWDIKTVDTGEDTEKKALADKQASDLRAAYDAISNLRDALNFLALAELRGFSHVEKIYAREGTDPWLVNELRIVDQWFWCRNGFYGDWQYNPTASETNLGEPIDPAHFVIHAIDDPADEIFSEIVLNRRISDADWDGFLEDYGIPPMFIVLPPNVPKEREAEFQRAAELAVSAARGSLPNGASLQTPSAGGSGGAGVFKERLEYLDGQIVIAGTSGKLTVLSESGTGTLSGGAQKEAFDEIAQAIADQISGVLQKQFDKPLLDRTHPNEPILAYFQFAAVDEEETGKILDDAVKAAEAGYAIEEEELSEKTGYKLRYVGVPNQTSKEITNKAPASSAASVPGQVGAQPAQGNEPPPGPTPGGGVTPVDRVAQILAVAPEFVAPGKKIIDDLLSLGADKSVSVDDLFAAAEDLLAAAPELATKASLDSVVDALQGAMQSAAEATLGGVANA